MRNDVGKVESALVSLAKNPVGAGLVDFEPDEVVTLGQPLAQRFETGAGGPAQLARESWCAPSRYSPGVWPVLRRKKRPKYDGS